MKQKNEIIVIARYRIKRNQPFEKIVKLILPYKTSAYRAC